MKPLDLVLFFNKNPSLITCYDNVNFFNRYLKLFFFKYQIPISDRHKKHPEHLWTSITSIFFFL
jgi:hypothetical protein